MPDPRLELSYQELLYAATALRAEAAHGDQTAADPAYESTRGLFRESAARTRELAAKFDQVAGGVRRPMEERHTDNPNWRRFSL